MLAVALCGSAAVYGARPTVSYRALELGASTAEIGLIASAFALLALLAAVPVGRAADRLGGRIVVVGGALTAAIALGILMVADSLLLLGLGQAVLGLGQLMLAVGTQTVLAHLSGLHRDRSIGTYSAANSLGHGLGPTLAGYIAGDAIGGSGGQLVFLVAGLAALATGAIAATSHAYPRRSRDTDTRQVRSSVLETLSRPGMRQGILGSVVLLTAMDLLVAYLPVYGQARGIAPETIGIAIGALAASQVVPRLFLGRAIELVGQGPLIIISMALPAVLVPVLIFPVSDPALIVVMAAIGVNLGLGQPLTLIMVAVSATLDSRGLAVSLRLVGNRLGQISVPALFGSTAGQAGVSGIMLAVAASLGLGCLVVVVDRWAISRTARHG